MAATRQGLPASARLVAVARTSGEENDTGQDVRAQGEALAHRITTAGGQIAAVLHDDGVGGDTDPYTRPAMVEARRLVLAGQADAIAMMNPSRYSRAHYCQAVLWFEAERVPFWFADESGGLSTWGMEKLPHQLPPNPAKSLIRGVVFYGPWDQLVAIRTSTGAAMEEIKTGRRPTKSGKPAHRPRREIPAPVMEAARQAVEGGKPLAEALRIANRMLTEGIRDEETIRKRRIGKGTLARALGLWSAPGGPKGADGAPGGSS